ncbi:MAG: cyclopropane-fatty-acyl-phospholipid synthase family protein [Clostridiales bacterium]|nr:cyclopropane-fatty-acyl-phospholipid synthase family protein [Clostridiales bacterium]MCF8022248.1 cyclopropane-fatty-acyl-phospholipid synthase family protein [Clostridiales bacterium]
MKKSLLNSFFEKITNGDFEVVYWDGERKQYGNGEPKVKIIFNKPLSADYNLDDPVLAFGEAYMDEIVDFEGSFEEVLWIATQNDDNFKENGLREKAFSAFKSLNNQIKNQKDNIQHHYDLGNDFFSLWLDESMNYSCAYFKTPEDSLYRAQLQKVDHVIKKLNLQPGERLLDIGSGWGWLIIRAAQQHDVKATGITISEEQYRAAKKRIEELGLGDLVDVLLLDYLDLDESKYQFDKVVSVGMFEHVGKDNLGVYMDKVNKLLVPGGLSMLHTITGVQEKGVNSWIDKYIFPGGYIPSIRETIWLLPEYNFHLLHAESLRIHYAMTLDRWYENFCDNLDYIEQQFGRRFVRMWGLYLRSCAASFRVSGLNIHQLLFSKGLNNNLPLTMESLVTS